MGRDPSAAHLTHSRAPRRGAGARTSLAGELATGLTCSVGYLAGYGCGRLIRSTTHVAAQVATSITRLTLPDAAGAEVTSAHRHTRKTTP